jgi:hypothetical protein
VHKPVAHVQGAVRQLGLGGERHERVDALQFLQPLLDVVGRQTQHFGGDRRVEQVALYAGRGE